MRKRHILIVGLVAACGAAVAGTWAGRWARSCHTESPPPVASPIVVVDLNQLHFGEVWETDQFEVVLPLRNNSSRAVRVTEWRSSCNCLGVEPPSLDFAANESKTIRVKIDLASKLRMNPNVPQAVGVNLSGILSDGAITTWQIRGTLKPVVKAYPDLVFPPLSELAKPYEVKPINLEFTEPVSIDGVESDSPFITASHTQSSALPTTRYPIELSLARVIPIGEHRFTVSFHVTTQSPRQQVVKRLGGVLRIVSDVQGDPGQVVFPAKGVGEESEESVVVKSLTGRAVHIDAVTAEGEGLTVDRMKGESQLVVRQRSTKVGQTTTYVRVTARSEERRYDIVIPVTSLGIRP